MPASRAVPSVVGVAALLLITSSAPASSADPEPPPGSRATAATTPAPPLQASDLAGTWSGVASHAGETSPFALRLDPRGDGKVDVHVSIPAIHLDDQPLGARPLAIEGDVVRLGSWELRLDRGTGTLTGVVPEGLAPLYALPLRLRRGERLASPPRPGPGGTEVAPLWATDVKSPVWAGVTFADGLVYAGTDGGVLHALEASTGRTLWTFAAGGALRSPATVAGDTVYVPADDGVLYALGARSGKERWRQRVNSSPVVRLPFDDPKSRYDRAGSGVVVAGEILYLGTHDGHVLALDRSTGRKRWSFAADDSVLAAPSLDAGRLYFGSYGGHVYALDAGAGTLLWKHDTRRPVVSTPAVARGKVLVGSRSYDFLALDAKTGVPAWTRYLWFSWVESSPTVHGAVAYVGSSDAARVYAFDVDSGRTVWETDVHGWAWGRPTATADRVFVGTSSSPGYLVGHQAAALALERATGRVVWREVVSPAGTGTYGFTGQPAVGAGLVFFGGLDGKVRAYNGSRADVSPGTGTATGSPGRTSP